MPILIMVLLQGVMKMRKRVTLTVATVSVIFGGCYLAESSNFVMENYHPSGAFLSWNARSTMILINSAFNPIVYALGNERFREKFKKMLCCTCGPAANMVHPVRGPHDQRMEVAIGPNHTTQKTDKS